MKATTDDKLAFEKPWSIVNAAKYAGLSWNGTVSSNMGSLKDFVLMNIHNYVYHIVIMEIRSA